LTPRFRPELRTSSGACGFLPGWPSRKALELLTPEIVQGIGALAKIRNEFAHGLQDELTPAQTKAILRSVEPFIGDDSDIGDYSEGDAARLCVAILWQMTQDTVEHALQQREQAAAALAEYQESRKLTPQEVAALVAGDDDTWEGL
jgi:hypothetical protein